ncbi:2-dehydro-3-deoxygalactonokinase [Aureimonas sp. N4]|uniref:2-dehydro-3-deoxygalactonokinase n=1 Tax=Aureimonas sp. N4 TaxID=1638165 RepID=UPI00078585B5|nr:2-dehydro-3-deoxygalactonokinase [Aureimonas sp. N4]
MLPTYAAVDWGTTSFRAWAIDGNGNVLNETRARDGLTTAAERGFETVLEQHLAELGLGPDAPAVLCGMVGSRAGWVEAAYLETPLELGDLGARAIKVPGIARPVFILPGLAQRASWEPDVMRGEETQLLGVVAEGYRTGLVCMPGTHSKWVSLSDGVIEAFSTFMTGELFQLLRSQSILKQAVEGEGSVAATPAFLDGVRRAFEAPALATNFLFSIRAGWLLHGAALTDQAARLSGLLLGLELAGAAERHGDLHGAALLASGPIADLYVAAFEAIGMGAFRRLDADSCVRHGLAQAAISLFSKES